MHNYTNSINLDINELKNLIGYVEKFLADAPNGNIQIASANKKSSFCHCLQKNGITLKKYLNKENHNLISLLCNKEYCRKLLPVLKAELMAMETFQNDYDFMKKYEVYRNLHPEKQKFVRPLFDTVQTKVDAWKESPYRPLVFRENEQAFDTDQGEKVRSKSEFMIANELYKRRDQLLYRYEQALRLDDSVVYPDFEIISLKTGKIYYYEHFGRMDDAQYLEGFIKKMQRYTRSGILLGQNLIATFESSEKPLHLSEIKAALEIID